MACSCPSWKREQGQLKMSKQGHVRGHAQARLDCLSSWCTTAACVCHPPSRGERPHASAKVTPLNLAKSRCQAQNLMENKVQLPNTRFCHVYAAYWKDCCMGEAWLPPQDSARQHVSVLANSRPNLHHGPVCNRTRHCYHPHARRMTPGRR